MAITVRKAGKKDLPRWAEMRNKLWPESTGEEHLKEIRSWLKHKTFQAWMAFFDGKAAGFAEASIRPFANGCDSRPVAFLEGIWIDKQFQRHGIGRELLATVEKWAKKKGIKELGSDTDIDNKDSQMFHLKMGFEEMERVVYFRKKL